MITPDPSIVPPRPSRRNPTPSGRLRRGCPAPTPAGCEAMVEGRAAYVLAPARRVRSGVSGMLQIQLTKTPVP